MGIAFITAGCVGIYMMLGTREVAGKIYKKFDEQNEILREIASSQKDIVSSQKDILAVLKESNGKGR